MLALELLMWVLQENKITFVVSGDLMFVACLMWVLKDLSPSMFPTLPGIEDYSSWIVARFCIIKFFYIIILIINVIVIVIVIVIVNVPIV